MLTLSPEEVTQELALLQMKFYIKSFGTSCFKRIPLISYSIVSQGTQGAELVSHDETQKAVSRIPPTEGCDQARHLHRLGEDNPCRQTQSYPKTGSTLQSLEE